MGRTEAYRWSSKSLAHGKQLQGIRKQARPSLKEHTSPESFRVSASQGITCYRGQCWPNRPGNPSLSITSTIQPTGQKRKRSGETDTLDQPIPKQQRLSPTL